MQILISRRLNETAYNLVKTAKLCTTLCTKYIPWYTNVSNIYNVMISTLKTYFLSMPLLRKFQNNGRTLKQTRHYSHLKNLISFCNYIRNQIKCET